MNQWLRTVKVARGESICYRDVECKHKGKKSRCEFDGYCPLKQLRW